MIKVEPVYIGPYAEINTFSKDGTTRPYGTVIGGWYWYNEMLYKNNGALVPRDNETTDVHSLDWAQT